MTHGARRGAVGNDCDARGTDASSDLARLTALIEALPDTVILVDDSGRVVEVWPGEGASFLPVPPVGRPLAETLIDDEAERLRLLLDGVNDEDAKRVMVLERIADDGSRCVWECRVASVRQAGEALLLVRDVTALAGLHDQVMSLSQSAAVARAAKGAAHDINNALAVIRSYAAVLRRRTDDAVAEADLDAVLAAAELASRLCTGIVDLAKPRGPGPCELGALLGSMERGIRLLLGEAIEVEIALPSRPIRADIEAERLEQIVLNLVFNAREAMPNGGRLRVALTGGDAADGVRGDAGEVELVVEDNGTGIPPAALPYIFEPHFTTRLGHGAGLGLANVRAVLLDAGGRVDVESEEGRGTRVIVRLPVPRAGGALD